MLLSHTTISYNLNVGRLNPGNACYHPVHNFVVYLANVSKGKV